MIRSSVSELKQLSTKDDNLKRYLNTEIRYLPKWVEYSIGRRYYKEFFNRTFLDYLTSLFDGDPLMGLYLTLDGDEVLGWMAYINEEWNRIISDVRFGTFRFEESESDRIKNLRFMQDIRRTFERKIHSGIKVLFTADENCPFNRHYYNYIKEARGGQAVNTGRGYISFSIEETGRKRNLI